MPNNWFIDKEPMGGQNLIFIHNDELFIGTFDGYSKIFKEKGYEDGLHDKVDKWMPLPLFDGDHWIQSDVSPDEYNTVKIVKTVSEITLGVYRTDFDDFDGEPYWHDATVGDEEELVVLGWLEIAI